MAAFADEFSPKSVAVLGSELQRAWSDFPLEAWSRLAGEGLAPLALLERVAHIASALAACLPDDFGEATAVLHRALDSPGLDGWITLPCGQFVADNGLERPDTALPLLAALSPRFSSESPMRPFIDHHPELTFSYLRRWADHSDEHVRRLVSECTRPRLPWAAQLRDLMADPTPSIELLDLLFDDSSEYVRRSVANHLNDISKDHPNLAVDIAKRWMPSSTHGNWVIKHGLRSLVKRGDPAALAVLGFDQTKKVTLESIEVEPRTVTIGGAVTLTAELSAETTTPAVIDFVVHYQGARKPRAGKVFKLTNRTIEPEAICSVTKRHRFEHVSIRRIYPGKHRIEIQVNGKVLGGCDLTVVDPAREV